MGNNGGSPRKDTAEEEVNDDIQRIISRTRIMPRGTRQDATEDQSLKQELDKEFQKMLTAFRIIQLENILRQSIKQAESDDEQRLKTRSGLFLGSSPRKNTAEGHGIGKEGSDDIQRFGAGLGFFQESSPKKNTEEGHGIGKEESDDFQRFGAGLGFFQGSSPRKNTAEGHDIGKEESDDIQRFGAGLGFFQLRSTMKDAEKCHSNKQEESDDIQRARSVIFPEMSSNIPDIRNNIRKDAANDKSLVKKTTDEKQRVRAKSGYLFGTRSNIPDIRNNIRKDAANDKSLKKTPIDEKQRVRPRSEYLFGMRSGIMNDSNNKKSVSSEESDDKQRMTPRSGFGKKKEIASYLKGTDEKGFVLIINYRFSGEDNERHGSDKDVLKLKRFFRERNYETVLQCDMSTDELQDYLNYIRTSVLDTSESKYHCFICVAMSHGNESDLGTTDGSITRNEIVDFFRNDKLRHFIGKPKIFMFQTCRGDQIQLKHGNESPQSTIQRDRSNVTKRMPRDADIMIICATTHGHFSYRAMTGSWLIKVFLKTAANYPDRHIAEIMTEVRHELATNDEYEDNGECQIAVTENTLTQLFYL